MRNIFLLLCFLACTTGELYAQARIGFSLRNLQVVGQNIEFDIYAKADKPNTFHSRGQVYINYNQLVFGDSAVNAGRVTYTHLALLNEMSIVGPKYITVNLADNTNNRLGITWQNNLLAFGPSPAAQTEVPTTWTPLYHFVMETINNTVSPNLTLEESLMTGQQFFLIAPQTEVPYLLWAPFPHLVSGNVYSDVNGNCTKDAGDLGLSNMLITTSNGFFAFTDSLGDYTLEADTGSFTVEAIPLQGRNWSPSNTCPPIGLHQVQFLPTDGDSSGLDFAFQLPDCHHLEVALSSRSRGFCQAGTTSIRYQNTGTAVAPLAKVIVDYPDYMTVSSASHSFTQNAKGQYVFAIGDLLPNAEGIITLTDSLGCDPDLQGLTPCIKAWATPANNRCPNPNPLWSGADIQVEGTCLSGTDLVEFFIENVGSADMADSVGYRLFADDTLIDVGKTYLLAGNYYRMQVRSLGQTIRLELDQELHHPDNRWMASTVEACGTNIGLSVSQGFVSHFATHDKHQHNLDIICQYIDTLQAPNHKSASPYGPALPYLITDSTRIHYRIEFQNLTSDTLDCLAVLDTLSEAIDFSTFQAGPSSHSYELVVFDNNPTQVLFKFYDHDFLPTDKGYLSYSLQPQAGLPANTIIRNQAYIYLRPDSIIPTNITLHETSRSYFTALDPARVTGMGTAISPDIAASAIQLYPNPATDFLTISLPNGLPQPISMAVYDPVGRLLLREDLDSGKQTLAIGQWQRGWVIVVFDVKGRTIAKRLWVR